MAYRTLHQNCYTSAIKILKTVSLQCCIKVCWWIWFSFLLHPFPSRSIKEGSLKLSTFFSPSPSALKRKTRFEARITTTCIINCRPWEQFCWDVRGRGQFARNSKAASNTCLDFAVNADMWEANETRPGPRSHNLPLQTQLPSFVIDGINKHEKPLL